MTEHSQPRRRRRVTRRSVIVTERLARLFITVGGLATTVAVGLICVFLVAVVLPLFGGAEKLATTELSRLDRRLAHLVIDEYDSMAVGIDVDGGFAVTRADTGALLETREAPPGPAPTAQSFPAGTGDLAFGYEDGTVRLGSVGFTVEFYEPDAAPAGLTPAEIGRLEVGEIAPHGRGILEFTPSSQLRVEETELALEEPLAVSGSASIRLLDVSRSPSGLSLGTLDADGKLAVHKVREKENLLTGKVTRTLRTIELPPLEARPSGAAPNVLLLSGLGDQLYLLWPDGLLHRYDLRDEEVGPQLVESLDLVEEPGAEVTAAKFLLGGGTLAIGDSLGRLRTWFRAARENAGTLDRSLLVNVHEFDGPDGAAVTDIAPSPRSRTVAVGYSNGVVRLFQATTGRQLIELGSELSRVERLVVSPKETSVLAYGDDKLLRWDLDLGYPEASLGALFGTVWYEGYPEPSPHVWQSTGGTDDFEPKLGLRVLIFGTIKGTIYSMLFGAPIAILAAIYTSEFLNKRLRSPIKSIIELMAGLPSVVLGFLAGVVLAPLVQGSLAGVLLVFLTAPLAILCGAQLWSVLPKRWRLQLEGWPRLGAVGVAILFGCIAPVWLGPVVERLLFAGDMEAWLDGQRGSALGGWLMLLLPLCIALVAWFGAKQLDPWLKRRTSGASEGEINRVRMLRFLGIAAAGILLAWGAGASLTGLGFDLRGGVLDTYVQRNALVVGFIMGFAIIPVIYTLAEDALSSVPNHLREASLGAGATPWQTAVRVILPTASSGIFSAVMIGLGRAVGETMIVLMATGNTPVHDWNIFNGFRTLSANIAVELPEAVHGDTHYRTLFLAALTLFTMTFVLNTFAERLRAKSRKRAFQL